MSLLIDQNLSPRVADLLVESGIAATHVRSVGLRDASDDRILEFARENRMSVVSRDSDFTQLLAVSKAVAPSVVLLRLPHVIAAQDVASFIRDYHPVFKDELERGAIISVSAQQVRSRRLPLP